MTLYDDFLGLAGLDLSPYRLIVFHGRSGSGKSTAIRFLLDHQLRHERIQVIDEIATIRELVNMRRVLRRRSLVATHVSPLWVGLIAGGDMKVFRTDTDGTKIARYLARLGVKASPAACDRYVREFGATYTDIDLILERCPSPEFDISLSRFLKFHRIELAKIPLTPPV